MLNCYKKLKKNIFFVIWNHGNCDTLFLFNTHEYQKTQIKNPFDPILCFGLIKYFWKWKFLSIKKNILTKDFQRIHKIELSWWSKKWDHNSLLNTLKKHSQFQKCEILKLWKFKVCTLNSKFQKLQECFTTYKWGICTWCIKQSFSLYYIKFNFKK